MKKLKSILTIALLGATVLFTSCGKEKNKELISCSLSPTTMTLVSVGQTGDITITPLPANATVNFSWSSSDNSVATVEKTGDLTARVTAVGDGTTTITATSGGVSKICAVEVKIGGAVTSTIYSEDFGDAATASPWPSAAEYTGYSRGGLGGANVVYGQEGGAVSIRGNNVSDNNGYPGASGKCNAMMAALGANFVIKDIATCGATNFKLSFGAGQTNTIMSVAYRVYNTQDWVSLPFIKEDEYWGYVEGLAFTVPTGTNTISLKFTALETTYGTRVDDILLTTEDATSTPVIDVEEPIVVKCDVVDLPITVSINSAIPECWEYITNNPSYPDAAFYSNGGLKLNFENMGITSREFNPQQNVKVTIDIAAFNASTKTTSVSTDIFTVKGYNSSGTVVATGTLTSVQVGDNIVNLSGTENIVKIDVVMTGYYITDGFCQNINLKNIKIETNN